jgi:heme/copper-type cytochrome/quinol oxidase subunit 3
MSGPQSQAWWAVVLLMLVSGSIYGCALFSYLYLWTVSPQMWPQELPGWGGALVSALLFVAASAAFGLANRCLKKNRLFQAGACLVGASLLLPAAVAVQFLSHAGLSASESAYCAIVYLIAGLAGFYTFVCCALNLFVLARATKGMLSPVRRVTFDNARLLFHYTVAQSLIGLAVVHGFPRLVS